MTIGEFLGWWGTQLQESVPGFVRRRLRRAKTTLTLRIADGTVTFLGPNGMPPFSCELPKEDPKQPPAGLDDFLTALPAPLQCVRVELAPQEYLHKDFSLPRAARAHLTETVGYQLSKLTPFSAEQMLYACGTAPDASNDGPLSVWLAGVPRHRVARPLALLGQPPPDNPLPLDAPPAPDQPLVFSWPLAPTTARSPRRLRLAWVGVFALWVAATGLHIYNRFESARSTTPRSARCAPRPHRPPPCARTSTTSPRSRHGCTSASRRRCRHSWCWIPWRRYWMTVAGCSGST